MTGAARTAACGADEGPLTHLVGATSGQASVELVAVLPVLLAVALGVGQLLAWGAAEELAAGAAHAGATALLQGLDPRDEARAAVPGWSREDLRVAVRGRRVEVRLDPPRLLPLVPRLEASATADAGPPAGEGPR